MAKKRFYAVFIKSDDVTPEGAKAAFVEFQKKLAQKGMITND